MERVVVLAKFIATPGHRDEAVRRLRAFVDAAHDEPGVEVYAMHEDIDDPDAVWFYEIYADEAGYQAHLDSPVRLANRGLLDGLRGAPLTVFRLRGVQAKGLAVC